MSLFDGKYRIPSARLAGWDYSTPGYYFVTICARGRQEYFGKIAQGCVVLSPLGEIARRLWVEIPIHFPGVALDEFVIMPNHMHGIIVILPHGGVVETHGVVVETHGVVVETQHAASLPRPGSLSTIIRSYKSAVTRQARLDGHNEFGWQARFYDHIIRHPDAMQRIRAYIRINPAKWDRDRNHPARSAGGD